MNSPATVASPLSKLPSSVEDRFETWLPVLKDRLQDLYGNSAHYDTWLQAFVKSICIEAFNRPPHLRQQDQERATNPNWHLELGLAYVAYADHFAGGLRGVIDRIPHLKDMGVGYLHLLPFLKAGPPPNDGGFAVASFEDVDPRLGSNEDLAALLAALRAAGISLCCDFVLNHVSDHHPWALAAKRGNESARRRFHWLATPSEVAEHERHLKQIFPETAPGNFTWVPECQAYAWTTFYPFQWDLNYAEPEVFSDIALALLRLANRGIDAFRLDSTAFLWKRLGTPCSNLPQVHSILQALRAVVEIAAPGVLLKAEVIMPTRDLPPYFGLASGETMPSTAQPSIHQPECHLAYHASLMAASWAALAEEDAAFPKAVLRATPTLPTGAGWLTYVRCHDDIGWGVLRPECLDLNDPDALRLKAASSFFSSSNPESYAEGSPFQSSDPANPHGTNGMLASLVGLHKAHQSGSPEQLELALLRYGLMHALALFVGDLPLVYMGDEFGQANLSPEAIKLRGGDDGRELHRVVWSDSIYQDRLNAGTVSGMAWGVFKRLSQARSRMAATLSHGSCSIYAGISDSQHLLCLQRGSSVGLFNFSSQHQILDWRQQPKELTDWMTLKGVAPPQGLGPYEARWLHIKGME